MIKVAYNACFGGFSLSYEAQKMLCELKGLEPPKRNKFGSYHNYQISRHDPDLIKVIEAMGKEASGEFAAVMVCSLSGNKYRIDEYDGRETVVEPNEEEWIVVE